MSSPILCFHRHSRFVPSFSRSQTPFHAKAQSTQRPQSRTTPNPSSSEEGSTEFRALERRGQGWLIFAPAFVFIHILALFPGFGSADRRVCGPRFVRANAENPQTAEPAVCAARTPLTHDVSGDKRPAPHNACNGSLSLWVLSRDKQS